eukprot:2564736-Pleurochrysis_carterae.AAC.1
MDACASAWTLARECERMVSLTKVRIHSWHPSAYTAARLLRAPPCVLVFGARSSARARARALARVRACAHARACACA